MFAQLERAEIFAQAKEHALAYLAASRTRRVYPDAAALAGLAVFDEPLPVAPGDPSAILRLLHEHAAPATVATTGGRYFGFVTGGAVPAALAARWLSDVWDQAAALHVLSPAVSRLEAVCERWTVDLLGLPADTRAGFVSGTSAATLCGLAAGRNTLLARQGWDVNARGLFGAPALRVIVSEQAHATVFKALALLGLGRERVELAPHDEQGRIVAARMPALDATCLVIAQAGHVNTGAFDPLAEITTRARAAGAWVHVDGAFGLWAAASPAKAHLVAAMADADSWSVDAHKTLNAPYDSGIILCRDGGALVSALQAVESYILYGDQRDGMLYTPEMSRRARAVELWATYKALGRAGIAELVDRLCAHAARFGERLAAEGFHVRNDIVFNQVIVACDTPALTQATLRGVQESGECWVGGATWRGEPVIRVSVCSWATTEADVDRSVAAFAAARAASRTDSAARPA